MMSDVYVIFVCYVNFSPVKCSKIEIIEHITLDPHHCNASELEQKIRNTLHVYVVGIRKRLDMMLNVSKVIHFAGKEHSGWSLLSIRVSPPQSSGREQRNVSPEGPPFSTHTSSHIKPVDIT